jgi:hypothetical protein
MFLGRYSKFSQYGMSHTGAEVSRIRNLDRNDHNLNGRGILLAVKETFLISAVPELQTN